MSFLRIPSLLSMARSVAILSTASLELGAAGFLAAQPIDVGETQTNRDGQVTVAVAWAGPTAGPVFSVVLDTHSVDLDRYDLGALAFAATRDPRCGPSPGTHLWVDTIVRDRWSFPMRHRTGHP